MSEHPIAQVQRDGVNGHPAVRAWRTLHPDSIEPETITAVKQSRCAVYRLEGIDAGGSALIAKVHSSARLVAERTVYQEVLPHLPIFALRCHGYVEEEDGAIGWLFIEDAGGIGYSPRVADHSAVAGRWIGRLHTLAAQIAPPSSLPCRGSDYYREHLWAAHHMLIRTLTSPVLHTGDSAIIRAAADHCEFLDLRWRHVAELCDSVPRTLVHGDFAARNVRLRRRWNGADLASFDWEMAGWGVPAIDLAQDTLRSVSPDLCAYWLVVRHSWPHLDLEDIRRLADLGGAFRRLVVISWARTYYHESEWAALGLTELRQYYVELTHAIEELKRWI